MVSTLDRRVRLLGRVGKCDVVMRKLNTFSLELSEDEGEEPIHDTLRIGETVANGGAAVEQQDDVYV